MFPRENLFPLTYADGIAPRLGVSKDLTSAMIRGDIGGYLPVLELDLPGTTLQCGAGAAVLTSFIKKPRLLQMVTVDFLLEFPLDVRLPGGCVLRTGYGHFSAHLADDGIEILGRTSTNYAKDYVMLLGSYGIPAACAAIYAGGHWYFHSLPGEGHAWLAQAGLEAGNVELLNDVFLYAAADIRLKSEVAWASTQSYQCGLRLFPRDGRAMRIAYTYRTGVDDRGQFYTERSTTHLVGVYLDF